MQGQWCRAAIITRSDAVSLGFTDHDQPVTVEGVVCSPQGGFDGSSVEQSRGGSIDTTDVVGAFVNIDKDDLRAGLYSGATVRWFLFDWSAGAVLHEWPPGVLGDVEIEGNVFKAQIETKGARAINRKAGRIVSGACDADFGDARCGFNAASADASATVTATDGATWFEASATGAPSLGAWTAGRVIRGGVTYGLIGRTAKASGKFSVLGAFSPALEIGETVTLRPGCDRSWAMCQAIGNTDNFRGFPFVDSDAVAQYANKEDRNDGGSRFS